MKLVKEIKSQSGVLHFQRYLLFSTPWFNCYLHKIYEGDQDKHLHSHPWTFLGIILKGSYLEETQEGMNLKSFGSIGYGGRRYFHKIKKVLSPVTSVFFTGKKTYDWGYMTSEGFISHEQYRTLKHQGKLPSL